MRGRPRLGTALACVTLFVLSCNPAGTPTATPAPPPPAPTGSPSDVSTPGCSVPVVAGAFLGTYRSIGGGCIRAGRLLAVRCGSAGSPLVARKLQDRRPLVYLGGRFAVPVSTLPPDAVPVGISATERIFVLDRQLYIEAGGVVTRWLALPERTHLVARGPNTAMIGDSILDGALPSLPAALPVWELTVDAEVGRTSSGGRPLVAAAVSARPEVAVLELGTNVEDPTIIRANAEAMLSELAHVPLVVWVIPHTPSDLGPAMGREIRDAVATHPNATTADWDSFVPDDALMSDGVHLVPEQQGLFAEFLAPFLNGWLAAVRGRGAASCLDQVRRSV